MSGSWNSLFFEVLKPFFSGTDYMSLIAEAEVSVDNGELLRSISDKLGKLRCVDKRF
jgi:hypothetical protein